MGAQEFFNIALGKTADIAFADAQREARYQYGHAGYTGTIAEKDGYKLFSPAKGSLRGAEQVNTLCMRACFSDAEAEAELKRLFGDTQIVETFNNKWGPAVCVEISGPAATAIREAYNRKGADDKVWAFFGWASS